MTMITITLSPGEQEVLLKMADEVAAERGILTPWESIADKIRKTRKAEEAFREAYGQPDTTACGLCSTPRNSHDADDHHWQWNLAPVREAYVTRTGKVLTDADLKRYADEAEAGYDISNLTAKERETRRLYPDGFPGEPAG